MDVIQDIGWVISLGNAFTGQYESYSSDDEHSALLHRYSPFHLYVLSTSNGLDCSVSHSEQFLNLFLNFVHKTMGLLSFEGAALHD